MRNGVLLELFQSIDGLDADEAAKNSFRQMVCQIGREQGIKGIESAGRVQYAKDMLRKSYSRTTVMERLRARYCVSREQAYRYIREAL